MREKVNIKKMNLKNFQQMNKKEKTSLIGLLVFVIFTVAMIVVSTAVLHIPVVAVCSIVVLEALLCALLDRIPVWIHGLVVVAQIVAGIMVSKVVFMILMALVYVAAVALLYFWTSDK